MTIRIAHVSDLHLGAHDPAAVETLASDVAAAQPTLTVVTGDLTMRARPAQFRQAAALIERLPAPRLVVPGNHDIPLFAVGARLVRPYQRYRSAICEDLDPLVRAPGVTALGLNSMARVRWKNGGVTRKQAATVVDALAGEPVCVLALHHPPFAGGLSRLVGRSRLARAMAEAGVHLALAGHTHVPDARLVELAAGGRAHRLVAVTAGTATSRRVRGTARSWSLIDVEPGAVVVRERYHLGGGWRLGRTVSFPR